MAVICEIALGVAITELKDGIKGLIKNYVEYEPVLEDIAFTVDAIESVLVSRLEYQNTYLNLPVQRDVQEKLRKEIENGQKLVKECSEVGPSLSGCWKKTTMYTDRLRKLKVSLREQLTILVAQEVLANRTGRLVFHIAETLNALPQDGHPTYQNSQVVLDEIEVQDASAAAQLDTPKADVAECQTLQVFAPNTKQFPFVGRLFDSSLIDLFVSGFSLAATAMYPPIITVPIVDEVIFYKRIIIPLLKSIISNLESARPVFSQIAELNEELDLPKEEAEDVMQQIDEGVVLLGKLSKVHRWNFPKMYEYANELLDWEKFIQGPLCILHVLGIRECLLSVRVKSKEVTEVEMHNAKGLEQIATFTDLLAKIMTSSFRREAKGIKEPLKSHFASHESRLKYIISTLDSLEPLIHKIAKLSVEMDFPGEGVVQNVEKCSELIQKLCKARKLTLFKTHIHLNKLMGCEQCLRIQLDILIEQGIREVKKYLVSMRKTSEVLCRIETSSTSQVVEEVSVPVEIACPLKIPDLRSNFPPRLAQPQNKKNRVKSLAHKTHMSSSNEPAPPGNNASTHSQRKSSTNTAIVPVDQREYGKEESSHLYRDGMQDIYSVMQRFHVMSTRLLQSEERIKVLESNYRNAEESWKLENQKLSEQCNFAMAQVASLTKEKDSLAEKIALLEKNKVNASQEAQEILETKWVPDFRRQMQEAEEESYTLGCRVGFKSCLEKVENKFPYFDLDDISQFEPIKFDMTVIEDLLGSDYDNSDHDANHRDEEEEDDEEGGGKAAAQVPGDALQLLYHYAVRDMIDGTTITVDMGEQVLGVAKAMYILREDIIQFKRMTPISATCINVYMRHLYDVLKQSTIDGIFRFCEASSFSVGTPEEKSQLLATRLQQLLTNQILFVPYNRGCHWTLTVINEEKNICYYMDPLHSPIVPVEWEAVVNNGIEQWNYHQTGEAHQKRPVWKIVKGPKQPSNIECGYYVMRYMKEMVEDKSHSSAMKWDSKKYFNAYKETERAYTKTEVDELQLEWASLVYRSLPTSG